MAKVTLSVVDIDLAAGTYRVDYNAEGTEIDDGQATAALFIGFYLNTMIATDDFRDGVLSFGRNLIDALTRDGIRDQTEQRATMRLVLTDKDLSTGRFHATLEAEGGDMSGHSLPTTAQVVGAYMRSLVSDADFQQAVWAFAEEYVKNNDGAAIANSNNAPATTIAA